MTDSPKISIAELVEQLAVQTTRDNHPGLSLLRQLGNARISSTRRGEGGMSARSERLALNVEAHEMWEDITGQIATLVTQATDLRPGPEPEWNLLQWWACFTAASARDETTLLMHEVAYERLDRWATRIKELLDPSPSWPLRGVACPECGNARVQIGEEHDVLAVVSDALIVTVADGELGATCRICAARWAGNTRVIHLARQAGIEINADAIRDARAPRDTPEPVDVAEVGLQTVD